MSEKHYRSVVKAISWRVSGTIDTIFISWLITGEITMAVTIGGAEVFTKLILFYSHERVWNKISLGRGKATDYQI